VTIKEGLGLKAKVYVNWSDTDPNSAKKHEIMLRGALLRPVCYLLGGLV